MNLKRVLIFSLTLLFGTACLFLTNLTAEIDYDSGDEMAGNAWGEAYVATWFDFPHAKSCHWVSLMNSGPVPIRYYYDFYMNISGPDDIFPLQVDDDGWVALDSSWSTSEIFSVNMRHKQGGRYMINAYTDLDIKADVNHDGLFDTFGGWYASCSTSFER